MRNPTEIQELNPNCRDYILEELAVLEGSVANGLGFSDLPSLKNNSQKQPLFIVYPGREENAFIQGKKQLKRFDTKQSPFLFDVRWLEISVHEDQEDMSLSPNKHCWSRFVSSAKTLFETKDKNLLFLISIGKEYHEGNYLQATVNLFANAMLGCIELINQEESLKQLNKQKNIDNAKGSWNITVIAADTLQAYNDPEFDNKKDQLLRQQYDKGQNWIKLATPVFEQLRTVSNGIFPVNIRITNWDNFLRTAKLDYFYQKYYSHLLNSYTHPALSAEAKLFYDAVSLKGFEFLNRVNKTKQKPTPAKLKDTKQLIGLSDIRRANTSQFIAEQSRVIKNFIYDLNPHLADVEIDLAKLAAGDSIPFHIPDLSQTKCIRRVSLLKQLDQLFNEPPPAKHSSVSSSIIACYGAGGMGKTHLVATYLNKPKYHYTLRIWINAGSHGELMISFKQLGQALMIIDEKMRYEDIRKKVIDWLENNPGWLLVMDDVCDYDDILDHLPQKGGHILFTSRKRPEKFNKTLEVDIMTDDEAMCLFSVISERNENEDKLKELVKKHGYLPLAIELAAAYLKKYPHISIQEYSDEYDRDCLIPMGNRELIGIAGGIAYKPIATSYNISMNRIREKYKDKNQKSKIIDIIELLLTVCSYLSSENIPLTLLERWFTKNCVQQYKIDQSFFEKIILQMKDHSFIKYDANNNLVSIHSVMQDILRAKHYKKLGYTIDTNDTIKIDEKIKSIDTISQAIIDIAAIKSDGEAYRWYENEERIVYLTHILKLSDFYHKAQQLTNNSAWINFISCQIFLMLKYYSKAINIFESIASSTAGNNSISFDLKVATLETSIYAYEVAGNVNAARSVFFLLHGNDATTDNNDPSNWLFAAKLSYYHNACAEPEKAKKLLLQILPNMRSYYGDDNFQVCEAIATLIEAYIKLGMTLDAKNLAESILDICESKKYVTLFRLSVCLAGIYTLFGQFYQARALIEKVIKIEDIQGPPFLIKHHKEQLKIHLAMSALYTSPPNEANEIIQETIQKGKKTLGSEDEGLAHLEALNRWRVSPTIKNELLFLEYASALNKHPDRRGIAQSYFSSFKLMSMKDSQSTVEQKLRSAAASNIPDALKIYISAVKNINSQDSNIASQKTALHWAVIKGSIECVSLLLAADASLTIPDATGRSPINYATEKSSEGSQFVTILEMLREHQILENTLKEMNVSESQRDTTFDQNTTSKLLLNSDAKKATEECKEKTTLDKTSELILDETLDEMLLDETLNNLAREETGNTFRPRS